MARKLFGEESVVRGAGRKDRNGGTRDNPLEVGRGLGIVNGVAAFAEYGGPCIVVDFGTAITFDAISAKGEYLGGSIAPGLGICRRPLFSRAARLPRVELRDPGKVIGTNTVSTFRPGAVCTGP